MGKIDGTKITVYNALRFWYNEKNGMLASFYMDPTLVAYGERQGSIMLGLIDGLMQSFNTPELRLQPW